MRSLVCIEHVSVVRDQRPKNSHNRIITGIGTPSNQSRIPRPMFASFDSSIGEKNAVRDLWFQRT
jgi:hypothetical protein